MDTKRPCLSRSKQSPHRSVACNVVGNTKYLFVTVEVQIPKTKKNLVSILASYCRGRVEQGRRYEEHGTSCLLSNLPVALARSLERAP